MTIWFDAHLSPRIARWLTETFGITAVAIRDLGLREAEDEVIFFAARNAGADIISKDRNFVELLERHGSPPKIIWLTCGNTSETALREILGCTFAETLRLLDSGEILVEIGLQGL